MILAALDQSIVNTVLPRMASDLGGLAHFSWVVTAFTLSLTIATQIRCKLGDMFGRRTFLVICIRLFMAASTLCGVARSMGQLIAFRFLQGMGGGGLMTLSRTVIADVVTPSERMRY
ncbi:MFS transporter [Salipiger thiooxidans]|uniref:MFS transporter n=1 Tax=Salipiger thiooxidans TaxID=282683 RepID=UPI001A900E00|nr:MFS transporter [Salipiger thiooxidans]MBN8185374.1 MFS transporter [Salipiger thiooxidans]